ncbi:hypothetical protein FD19_GL000815 [Lacticaseibacillus thailandensis DSM 22698 = JCM 13996]|uniref:Uncharacterized protein n=1 Tax=Lacticaseibacillus thailandensis DSM 22698 = JCM 13996 TaxID=1423810 RepID=A0A0R2C4D9_9LACO|nr:hypothetical protein FD19_GL000815 [Lacticaseibacillus thailandensis DSM 22698 = JCM 13996]
MHPTTSNGSGVLFCYSAIKKNMYDSGHNSPATLVYLGNYPILTIIKAHLLIESKL